MPTKKSRFYSPIQPPSLSMSEPVCKTLDHDATDAALGRSGAENQPLLSSTRPPQLPELMLLRGMHDHGCDDIFIIVTDMKRAEMTPPRNSSLCQYTIGQTVARILGNPAPIIFLGIKTRNAMHSLLFCCHKREKIFRHHRNDSDSDPNDIEIERDPFRYLVPCGFLLFGENSTTRPITGPACLWHTSQDLGSNWNFSS